MAKANEVKDNLTSSAIMSTFKHVKGVAVFTKMSMTCL